MPLVDIVSAPLVPMSACSVVLKRSIVTATPTKLTVTRISPGPAVSTRPAIEPFSEWTGRRDESIDVGSVAYHQSRSLAPL